MLSRLHHEVRLKGKACLKLKATALQRPGYRSKMVPAGGLAGGWGYEWGQDVLNHSKDILGARF